MSEKTTEITTEPMMTADEFLRQIRGVAEASLVDSSMCRGCCLTCKHYIGTSTLLSVDDKGVPFTGGCLLIFARYIARMTAKKEVAAK